MLTHYSSSNGRLIAISDMADPHLDNAIGKLIRTGADDRMLEALRSEQSSRRKAGESLAAGIGRFKP